jgi:hypothetical protein
VHANVWRVHAWNMRRRLPWYACPFMRWRLYLIEWPATLLDAAWLGYKVIIAAVAILSLTTVALSVAAWCLFGFRLFW